MLISLHTLHCLIIIIHFIGAEAEGLNNLSQITQLKNAKLPWIMSLNLIPEIHSSLKTAAKSPRNRLQDRVVALIFLANIFFSVGSIF